MKASRSALWRVIYIARGEKQAQAIEQLLSQAGFMINVRQSDSAGEDFEIRALDAEAQEARLFLMEQGY